MYDSASIRRQLEEAWANYIIGETDTRRERANRYKTKKIIMQAHGARAYYDIEFPLEYLAMSHYPVLLSDINPLDNILDMPGMIGLWGAMAEVAGIVKGEVKEEVPEEEVMDEDMFFAQHFTSSLSEALGGNIKKQ